MHTYNIYIDGHKKFSIEASSKEDAIKHLKNKNISGTITDIKKEKRHLFSRDINTTYIRNFLQSVSFLTQKTSLLNAVKTIYELETNSTKKKMLQNIYHSVLNGSSFSESLKKLKKYFPENIINIIQAGEQSTKPHQTISMAVKHIDTKKEYISEIKKKITYPVIQIIFTISSLAFAIFYTFPKMKQNYMQAPETIKTFVFDSIQKGSTICSLIFYPLIISIILLILTTTVYLLLPKNQLKHRLELILLKIPLIKDILLNITIGNTTEVLSLLIKTGTNPIDAFAIASKTAQLIEIQKQFSSSYHAIKKTGNFNKIHPSLFDNQEKMLISGITDQQTAGDIFLHIAENKKEKTYKALKKLTQITIILGMLIIITVFLLQVKTIVFTQIKANQMITAK